MKSSVILLLLALPTVCISFAEGPLSFTTTTGRTFTDATIAKIEPDGIILRHSSGVAKVPPTEFPEEARRHFGIAGNPFAEVNGESVERLRSILESELDKHFRLRSDFEAKYVAYLEGLRDAAQNSGDPNKLVLVQNEIKGFANPDVRRDYQSFPQLANLRRIYEVKHQEVVSSIVVERAKTMSLYLERVHDLKVQATRGGDLEKGLEIAEEEERIEARMKAELAAKRPLSFPESPRGEIVGFPEPLWVLKSTDDFQTVGGIQIEFKDGAWHLEKGAGLNTRLLTNRTFSPPFRLVATVTGTTKSQIRFLFGEGFLAEFNVGPEEKDLVIHQPGGARSTVPNMGVIPPGIPHHFEFRVTKTLTQAYVNGALRGEVGGNPTVSDDKLDLVLGITPFRDNPVILERFEVWNYAPVSSE